MRLLVRLVLAGALVWGPAAAQEAAYDVALTGVGDADLADRIRENARLFSLKDEPPDSLAALERRADADVERVREVLRSEGFYAGEVSVRVDPGRPNKVAVAVVPGTRFTLQEFSVLWADPRAENLPEPVPLDQLDLRLGQPARAEPVVNARQRLLRALAEQGYPLARIADQRVVVDHAENAMRVSLEVRPGPLARFGAIDVRGLEDIDEAWVRRRVPWEPGEVFSVTAIEEMRQNLVASRLFSSVRIATADALSEDGRLPVTVTVEEAKPRSIGVTLSWSSAEGLATTAFWEHRNLMGGAEKLRAAMEVGETRTGADVDFRKPDFLGADQTLISSVVAEEERTDAYVSRTIGASAGMEWPVTPSWTASASAAVERTFEERGSRRLNYTLVSFPLEARHDSTDDVLDPTLGNRFRLQVRPFVEALGGTAGFTRIDLTDSQYVQVLDSPRVVLAAWGRLGTIRGASLDEVPSDKRFFVGGGGSVRGFGFQMAGPVDDSQDPVGGLSALAFGGEARVRITETIGIVPFIEGGSAFDTKWPDPDDGLFWGAGLGLRYITPIGPIRADVAIPLNPRDEIDDSYQVYLSLGQAF